MGAADIRVGHSSSLGHHACVIDQFLLFAGEKGHFAQTNRPPILAR